jgi:2,4-dienoyl-CoA reductase-like NADH-dependent reductase (Old Yellow Enzyme family)
MSKLSSPLKTQCGLVFSNRLVKAAMAESMADVENKPGDKYIAAYNTWSDGGWGAMLTGP